MVATTQAPRERGPHEGTRVRGLVQSSAAGAAGGSASLASRLTAKALAQHNSATGATPRQQPPPAALRGSRGGPLRPVSTPWAWEGSPPMAPTVAGCPALLGTGQTQHPPPPQTLHPRCCCRQPGLQTAPQQAPQPAHPPRRSPGRRRHAARRTAAGTGHRHRQRQRQRRLAPPAPLLDILLLAHPAHNALGRRRIGRRKREDRQHAPDRPQRSHPHPARRASCHPGKRLLGSSCPSCGRGRGAYRSGRGRRHPAGAPSR